MTAREDLTAEVIDESAILSSVERMANGAVTATVHVNIRFEINGVVYTIDRDLRCVAKRET